MIIYFTVYSETLQIHKDRGLRMKPGGPKGPQTCFHKVLLSHTRPTHHQLKHIITPGIRTDKTARVWLSDDHSVCCSQQCGACSRLALNAGLSERQPRSDRLNTRRRAPATRSHWLIQHSSSNKNSTPTCRGGGALLGAITSAAESRT